MKPRLTIDDYSIDKPLNICSNKYVFEQNSCFAFCHLLRMLVPSKIGHNDVNAYFLPASSEKDNVLVHTFWNKTIFQIIFQNFEAGIIFVHQSNFFQNVHREMYYNRK